MKIALAQINTITADIEGNRQKILDNIKNAKSANADLIIFPEMATVGYSPLDLLRHHKLLEDNIKSIELIARECKGIACICGFVEPHKDDSSVLFNSAAFMKDGLIVSRHQKTLLPRYDVFDEKRYFTPAKTHSIIDFMNHKIGITICEDIWDSESASDMMEQEHYAENPVLILKAMGAEMIINISASPFIQGKNAARIKMLQKLSTTHDMSIIYVNQIGGNDSLIFDGNSLLINDKGNIISHGGAFTESLTIANTESSAAINLEHDELENIRKALVLGLRDYARKCGFPACLLGLSGGIDSALVCALACEALGAENVLGITMPSMYSSQGSIDDSLMLAKNLGVQVVNIPIRDTYESFTKDLDVVFHGMDEDITEENLQSRIRGTLLMAISNKTGRLLLTTGNKSEMSMGYCTLYGDMNGGLAVISDLPKTLVYKLTYHINKVKIIIPTETIEKPPSAELRANQRDDDSLPPYDILDRILEKYIEERLSADEIIKLGFDEEIVLRVLNTVNYSEYKRRQAAPGLKVTTKAFGMGRRIPLAHKYKP